MEHLLLKSISLSGNRLYSVSDANKGITSITLIVTRNLF